MVDDTIYSVLVADAALVALRGQRLYPLEAPQDSLEPYQTYVRVSDVPWTVLDGTIVFREARYQISCYATNRRDARAMAEATITALHEYRAGDIKLARFENLMESVEPDIGSNGQSLYHVAADFMVTS